MAEKVVLISGASSGLGRDGASYLKERGYRVFGASRRCPDESLPFETVHLDVCDDASVHRAVGEVIDRAGRIDALVNVAGVVLSGAFENHSVEDARFMLETNTLGTFRMCRAVLPQMRAQGNGHIVNVSSLAGMMALPFASLYSASKFAVEGMTESLRMEVRRFGIAVSLLEPGDFLTAMTASYPWTDASKEDTVYREEAEQAIRIMEEDCRACPDLRIFSRRLESIIANPNPELRYSAGMILQRFAVPLHRVIPNGWFEQIIRSTYKLGTDSIAVKTLLDLANAVTSRKNDAKKG